MSERNTGHWEYSNFFTYHKWKRCDVGALEANCADRYNTETKVRYVGPEVEATNLLVDALTQGDNNGT
jgi:hypothetical protein